MTTTDQMPREALADVIAKTKTINVTGPTITALADAIVDGLERKGWVVAETGDVFDRPDESLKFLKRMRNKLDTTIEAEDTPPRDVASLSRRLFEVINTIQTIEERLRAAQPKTKGRKTNGSTNSSTGANGPAAIDA